MPNRFHKCFKMLNSDKMDAPRPFASAVEVDGVRPTLDSFMKQQEASKLGFQAGIDKILSIITTPNAIGQPVLPEDKGSNVKGKNIPTQQTQQFPTGVQPRHVVTNQGYNWYNHTMHAPQTSQFAVPSNQPDPPNAQNHGQVYYYEENFDPEMDWHQHPWNLGEEDSISSIRR